jgi:WD40 repeat protein
MAHPMRRRAGDERGRLTQHRPGSDLVACILGNGLILAASLSGPVGPSLAQEVSSLRPRDVIQTRYVNRVAFSPDGRTLASGGRDPSVTFWEAASGRERVRIPDLPRPGREEGEKANWVNCLAFAPDGRTVAAGYGDGTVKLWDTATYEVRSSFRAHGAGLRDLAYAPDGKALATTSWRGTSVRLWDTASGRERAVLEGHSIAISGGMAFSPDGRRLATAGRDDRLLLWDAATGRVQRVLVVDGEPEPGHRFFTDVAFAPDGATLAAAHIDMQAGRGAIHLWDVATGRERLMLTDNDPTNTTLVYSPDGRVLASYSSQMTIKLRDATTGRDLAVLRGHQEPVECMAYSPDGRLLASGGPDETLRLWDVSRISPPGP